jgi:D-alanine transfer protein
MSLPILRNSQLWSHVAAAATAVALAFGAYCGADDLLSRIVTPVSSAAAAAADKSNYLPNLGPDWGTQHVNLNRLGNALSDGTLVVLGSSELSSHDLRFVPYRFFPEELKVPTLAYGHAMFQSYGIVSVLESVADSLTPNTRLVIMVSPAWFASGGQLPRSAFAEHVTGPVWDRLWDQPNTREQMQNWISDNANWGLLWLIANGQVAELKDKLSLWWHARKEPAPDRPRSTRRAKSNAAWAATIPTTSATTTTSSTWRRCIRQRATNSPTWTPSPAPSWVTCRASWPCCKSAR